MVGGMVGAGAVIEKEREKKKEKRKRAEGRIISADRAALTFLIMFGGFGGVVGAG